MLEMPSKTNIKRRMHSWNYHTGNNISFPVGKIFFIYSVTLTDFINDQNNMRRVI